MRDENQPVEIGRFLHIQQAELVQSILAGSGVESYIDQQFTASIAPHYMLGSGGGVRVYVAADVADQAREILRVAELQDESESDAE